MVNVDQVIYQILPRRETARDTLLRLACESCFALAVSAVVGHLAAPVPCVAFDSASEYSPTILGCARTCDLQVVHGTTGSCTPGVLVAGNRCIPARNGRGARSPFFFAVSWQCWHSADHAVSTISSGSAARGVSRRRIVSSCVALARGLPPSFPVSVAAWDVPFRASTSVLTQYSVSFTPSNAPLWSMTLNSTLVAKNGFPPSIFARENTAYRCCWPLSSLMSTCLAFARHWPSGSGGRTA